MSDGQVWELDITDTAWWELHAMDPDLHYPHKEELKGFLEQAGLEVQGFALAMGGRYLLTSPDNPSGVWELYGGKTPESDDVKFLRIYLRADTPGPMMTTMALKALIRHVLPKE